MAETKMTKKKWFEALEGIVEASDFEDKDGALEFIQAQKDLLDAKAVKAKERAAQKKVEGDQMRDAVEAVLTDELQDIDTITAQVEFEGVTRAKVTSRLSQLFKLERVTKDSMKLEDGRKVTGYKLA